jgi:DNA-binding IclR family transcriptional regulator
MMRDENTVRQENESLRDAILALPEFRLLENLQLLNGASYKELSRIAGIKTAAVRKQVKLLVKQGYARVDKTTRPHTVLFMSAPWSYLAHAQSYSPRQAIAEPTQQVKTHQP